MKVQIRSLAILSTVVAAMFTSCGNNNVDKAKGDYEKVLEYSKFVDPPSQFREFPFYSLNDDLQPAEVARQIGEFADAGFGGFYLHSRDGMITEFLGDRWWEVMDTAVAVALDRGIQAWFFDEDKWPSGYAGGIIPSMGEEYRAKSMARLDKNTPLPEGAEILTEDENYRYVIHTAKMGNPKFNGTSWVDLMNPKVTRAFIDVAYKPYVERYKDKIKGYRFGIFADEPHIHARYFDSSTPHLGIYSYSPSVRDMFKKMWGYDFVDKIDLLFEEKDNWREVRIQYYQAIAQQFEEGYVRQVSDYCSQNGIAFTGHFIGEETLTKVRDRAGNTMLNYRYMQQPGIDMLGLAISGRLITGKSLSSVANQYGTPRRMSELYGISGQNINFTDRKWLAGWHASMGVNHYIPHLSLYSMRGLRKRDYPPTFSYHQPYWRFNKIFEDYVSRLSYIATVGEYYPQILVINPMDSERARGVDDGEFTQKFHKVLEELQEAHFDYDLGDEQIISEIAKNEGAKIRIGRMSYSSVIIPDVITLKASTINLLLKFADKGGKIFSTGRAPIYVDGLENEELTNEFSQKLQFIELKSLSETLSSYINPTVGIEGEGSENIWSQVRKADGGYLVQLYNSSYQKTLQFKLKSDLLVGDLILWDPDDAKCYTLKPDSEGMFDIEMRPASNIVITTGEAGVTNKIEGVYTIENKTEELFTLEKEWKGKRLDPNTYTIDFARYSFDGKKFSEPEPVIGIYKRLSDQNYAGDLFLAYSFNIDGGLPSNVRLSVEQPSMFEYITVNGKTVEFESDKYFLDRMFPSANVTEAMKSGVNTVDMKLTFKPAIEDSRSAVDRFGSEIESIYLFGDFSVEPVGQYEVVTNTHRNRNHNLVARPAYGFKSFSIKAAEDSIFVGDVTLEGYPFYAGGFDLEQTFDIDSLEQNSRYFVSFPNTEAIILLVEVNGSLIDTICWAPYRTDITDALKIGSNTLKVTMINSLRNLLGPHHNKNVEMIRVGPPNFTGAGGFPDGSGEKDWYDRRLKGEPTAIWRDTYWCIPFGMIEKPVIEVRR